MASKTGQEPSASVEDTEELLDTLDKTLDRLKTLYEQYFLGIQKQAPAYIHSDVERKLRDLMQLQIRNTGLRYRLNSLQAKFGAYNSYWRRTLRQIENGTYIRNLSKIGRQAARSGADIPDEILAAMPKRMREQVLRDREVALAAARRHHQIDDETLTLAEDDADAPVVIKETTELRRQVRGAHVVQEDADFDLDAFFKQVESSDEQTEQNQIPAPPAPPGPSGPAPVRAAAIGAPTRPSSPVLRTPTGPQPTVGGRMPTGPQPTVGGRMPTGPSPTPTQGGGRLPTGPSPTQTQAGVPPVPPNQTQAGVPPVPANQTQPMRMPTGPAATQTQPMRMPTGPAPTQTKPGVPPVPPPVPPPTRTPAAGSPVQTQVLGSRSGMPPVPGSPRSPTPLGGVPRVPPVPQAGSSPVQTQVLGSRSATPLGGVPRMPPPSQASRPNPIAPGSAAARGDVGVESMSGPFPRAQTEPSEPPEMARTTEIPRDMARTTEIPRDMARTTPIPRPPIPRAPNAPRPTPPVSSQSQPIPRPTPPRAEAPNKPPPGMTDADVNALYAKYVKAKEAVGEKVGPGGYGKLLNTINAQAPKIMEQYKAKGVDFSVVVKDNQVIIRAKPKP